MKLLTSIVLCSIAALASPSPTAAAGPAPLVPLADLEAQARTRTSAVARVPLRRRVADVLRGLDSFEPAGSGRVPNYVRALAAVKPATAKPFAHLLKTFAYAGNLSPALKLAMAVRIAQINRSAYGVAYLSRLLRATGSDGDALLAKIRANQVDTLAPADRLAFRWAELQTQDIHGMTRRGVPSAPRLLQRLGHRRADVHGVPVQLLCAHGGRTRPAGRAVGARRQREACGPAGVDA